MVGKERLTDRGEVSWGAVTVKLWGQSVGNHKPGSCQALGSVGPGSPRVRGLLLSRQGRKAQRSPKNRSQARKQRRFLSVPLVCEGAGDRVSLEVVFEGGFGCAKPQLAPRPSEVRLGLSLSPSDVAADPPPGEPGGCNPRGYRARVAECPPS